MLRRITTYFDLLQLTTTYCDVLRRITTYYDFVRRITTYDYVLRRIRRVTTYHDVLRRIKTYYDLLRRYVLRHSTTYYEVVRRITKYYDRLCFDIVTPKGGHPRGVATTGAMWFVACGNMLSHVALFRECFAMTVSPACPVGQCRPAGALLLKYMPMRSAGGSDILF